MESGLFLSGAQPLYPCNQAIVQRAQDEAHEVQWSDDSTSVHKFDVCVFENNCSYVVVGYKIHCTTSQWRGFHQPVIRSYHSVSLFLSTCWSLCNANMIYTTLIYYVVVCFYVFICVYLRWRFKINRSCLGITGEVSESELANVVMEIEEVTSKMAPSKSYAQPEHKRQPKFTQSRQLHVVLVIDASLSTLGFKFWLFESCAFAFRVRIVLCPTTCEHIVSENEAWALKTRNCWEIAKVLIWSCQRQFVVLMRSFTLACLFSKLVSQKVGMTSTAWWPGFRFGFLFGHVPLQTCLGGW